MIQSPVTEGAFRTGSEPMLWRPGLDHARLRRRMLLASLWPAPAAYAGVSAGLIMLGLPASATRIGWLILGAGLLTAGMAVLCWRVNYERCAEDHQHRPGVSCFLDRVPGEYFYRSSDFADLSAPVVHAVARIIDAVREVHASTAVAWLDPDQLRTIHRVAWNAVSIADHTRGLRALADDLRVDTVPSELAQAQVAAVDEALDEVQACLRQAVILVRAWEAKLAELDVRARLRAELENVPEGALAATVRGAELVPESLFAYLTAARDVTGAGPFPWERP